VGGFPGRTDRWLWEMLLREWDRSIQLGWELGLDDQCMPEEEILPSPRRVCKLQPSEAQERRQRVVVECVAEIIVRVSYLCIDELD
jgi:hypothetical protein